MRHLVKLNIDTADDQLASNRKNAKLPYFNRLFDESSLLISRPFVGTDVRCCQRSLSSQLKWWMMKRVWPRYFYLNSEHRIAVYLFKCILLKIFISSYLLQVYYLFNSIFTFFQSFHMDGIIFKKCTEHEVIITIWNLNEAQPRHLLLS